MDDVSFGRRFVALFIDWAVAMLTVAAVTRTPLAGEGAANSFLTLGTFFAQVTILVATLGFSIGKRIMGICVVGPDGRPIGFARAAVRTFLLCLVVPALIQNDEHRGFHEIASRSRQTRL